MASKKFGEELWSLVRKDLKRKPRLWWDEYKEDIVNLGEAEIKDVIRALRSTGVLAAKLEIASHMTRKEFTAYRDGTTLQLHGVAVRRARLLEALNTIGWRVARLLGAAAAAALGL